MSFKPSLQICFGALALMMTAVAVAEDSAAAASSTAEDPTLAEPSLYSAAYLPPKSIVVPHNPYEGAVASTSTNIVRAPGNLGQVAAFHKTVETPYSSVHKSDVRYTNDVQPYYAGPYPYAAPVGPYPYPAPAGPYPYTAPSGPYPYAAPAGPYPYSAAPTGPYPYAPTAAVVAPYSYAPVAAAAGPYPYAPASPIKPYGYGPVGPPPAYAASAPIVTPHSVSHSSFSGPYGTHYSYKR